MVYLAWDSRNEDGSYEADLASTNTYAGKIVVSAYNTATHSLDWYVTQAGYYGEGRSIAYIDNGSTGSNVYIGGRTEICQ